MGGMAPKGKADTFLMLDPVSKFWRPGKVA